MGKYIDADRLKAEIKRLKKHSEESKKEWIGEGYNQNAFAEDCRISSFDKLLSFIDSLQQEQESVAERFAKIVRGNLTGIDEKAQHEFEQLYFEITGNKMYGGYND